MKTSVLEKPSESVGSFDLNVVLKELRTNGVVHFSSNDNQKRDHSLWNGKKLRIPVYGFYKISWGFYQNSIDTFYKDDKSELALVINNKKLEEKAEVTKKTPSFHAVKSSQKTLTLLLREGELVSLNAEILKGENSSMKDIYLKVVKFNVEGNSEFDY